MRERIFETGIHTLQDHELFEVLLYSSIPRVNTNLTAHRLLNRFGDVCGVLNADEKELMKIDGIGDKSASVIKAVAGICRRYIMCQNEITNAFDDPDRLGRYLTGFFVGEAHEKLCLFVLSQSGRIDKIDCIAEGSVNAVNLPVRKIADMAVHHRSSYVVLAHNHPGGCAAPSPEDVELTLRAKETLGMLGIHLLEHFVISGNQYRPIIRSGYRGMKL